MSKTQEYVHYIAALTFEDYKTAYAVQWIRRDLKMGRRPFGLNLIINSRGPDFFGRVARAKKAAIAMGLV